MSEATPVRLQIPVGGEKITITNGKLHVPDQPIIPYIEGDGTGRDIWRASVRVFDAAVHKAYGGRRKIHWMEIFAGEKANKAYNSWLPDETVAACRDYLVSIKGPLTTPVGGGIRSLNVALRQLLDLYVCLRPVRWFKGSVARQDSGKSRHGHLPREHRGHLRRHRIRSGHGRLQEVPGTVQGEFSEAIREDPFSGQFRHRTQPASREGTERLFRSAVEYAIVNKRRASRSCTRKHHEIHRRCISQLVLPIGRA